MSTHRKYVSTVASWQTISFVFGITTLWNVNQLNKRKEIAVALHHPPRVSVLFDRDVGDAVLETTQPCQIIKGSARSQISQAHNVGAQRTVGIAPS